MQQTTPDAATRRARLAISVVFASHGVASGSFATAIPWIREHLHLTPGWLGIALVFLTVGASAAMSLSARLAHRYSPRPLLGWLSLMCCAGLALPALSPALVWLCLALFVYGCGLGLMDVAMNEHGVRIEERYGRSVMSGLHGVWSVGTLIGGAGGALAAHTGLDGRVHLALVAPVAAAAAVVASRWALDVPAEGSAPGGEAGEEPPRFALPPRAVLPIGVIGFCAIFAEGASMDWSGIYLRDVTQADPALAAGAFTAFASTMAVARLAGDAVVRRLGPVRTVRAGGLVAALGSALVVAAGSPGPAVAGFALIGVGIAVVVPLCFAAAGHSGTGSQGQAIAGVATLAYASGLAAPAAVGWIAEATSLTVSFGMVTVLLLGLVFGAGVLRSDAKPAAAGPAGKPAEHDAAREAEAQPADSGSSTPAGPGAASS
ncbi:Fucose permease [Streptomyces sp. WMMB 714]|jgi:MFS family permease|uniref:MFS transporter n=1 Tax=Streptomyces sp. WMMB 714 TaxID=1286822 RepID=UPI0008239A52|nr:MFS transporter [Streptomyces sp. WMMB 714]SCK06687.1 Fucose permease [Streptomyces sp. WMMB 714]